MCLSTPGRHTTASCSCIALLMSTVIFMSHRTSCKCTDKTVGVVHGTEGGGFSNDNACLISIIMLTCLWLLSLQLSRACSAVVVLAACAQRDLISMLAFEDNVITSECCDIFNRASTIHSLASRELRVMPSLMHSSSVQLLQHNLAPFVCICINTLQELFDENANAVSCYRTGKPLYFPMYHLITK